MKDKVDEINTSQFEDYVDTVVQRIENPDDCKLVKAILLNLNSLCETCKTLNYNLSIHFDPKIKNAKEIVMVCATPRPNSKDIVASVMPLIIQAASKVDRDVLPHLIEMIDTVADNPDATFNLSVNHEEPELDNSNQKPLH